ELKTYRDLQDILWILYSNELQKKYETRIEDARRDLHSPISFEPLEIELQYTRERIILVIRGKPVFFFERGNWSAGYLPEHTHFPGLDPMAAFTLFVDI